MSLYEYVKSRPIIILDTYGMSGVFPWPGTGGNPWVPSNPPRPKKSACESKPKINNFPESQWHYVFGDGRPALLGDEWLKWWYNNSPFPNTMMWSTVGQARIIARCDETVEFENSYVINDLVNTPDMLKHPWYAGAFGSIKKVEFKAKCTIECGKKHKQCKEKCCCDCEFDCDFSYDLHENFNWEGSNNYLAYPFFGWYGEPYDLEGNIDDRITGEFQKCL
jgi:hypothetical protein